jgi:hypothetical protein
VNTQPGRRRPTRWPHPGRGDRWGVLVNGGGIGLIAAAIGVASCDYTGHGAFVADTRLELLVLGTLVGVSGGALLLGWRATSRRRREPGDHR